MVKIINPIIKNERSAVKNLKFFENKGKIILKTMKILIFMIILQNLSL